LRRSTSRPRSGRSSKRCGACCPPTSRSSGAGPRPASPCAPTATRSSRS
jgi:hypothetical protein